MSEQDEGAPATPAPEQTQLNLPEIRVYWSPDGNLVWSVSNVRPWHLWAAAGMLTHVADNVAAQIAAEEARSRAEVANVAQSLGMERVLAERRGRRQ